MTPAVPLYDLLPEFLRREDFDRGEPLRALLGVVEGQVGIVGADIRHLWDNFFVETCDAWVLPYIADLIAVSLVGDDAASNRRDVARTIAYRRRKGTVPQLETMGGDVTGYDCRVVEFFERLVWTQSMIHVKPAARCTADVRDAREMARIDGAFDRSGHFADLRRSTQRSGRHAIRKLGFFLWRLRAIPLSGVAAQAAVVPAGNGSGFHFNVLGQPTPLFQAPSSAVRERGADSDWPRAGEVEVVAPISLHTFREVPDAFRQQPSGFTISVNGVPIAPQTIVAADLCAWTRPVNGTVAVDVRLGRMLFAPDVAPAAADEVATAHHFGLSGEIGGGGYERRATLAAPLAGETADVVRVSASGPVTTIAAALATLAASTAALRIVEIADSRTYAETLVLPAAFDTLVIQAANGERPVLELGAGASAFGGPTRGTRLVLNGLLITGAGRSLTLPAGVDAFVVDHCTIDPGGGVGPDGANARPAGVTIEIAAPAAGVTLHVTRSIVGALDLPETMECLSLADTIADGQAFPNAAVLDEGPPTTVLRSTVLGTFACHRLEADTAIFRDRTVAVRRQDGCVRFSYFGPESLVPRRFACAPADPPPVFVSAAFGDPAYAQLAQNCPLEIVNGDENGGEMGVWTSLGGPRRVARLGLRLGEYLPAGLEPLFVFVT